jgi:hypothetical protein
LCDHGTCITSVIGAAAEESQALRDEEIPSRSEE